MIGAKLFLKIKNIPTFFIGWTYRYTYVKLKCNSNVYKQLARKFKNNIFVSLSKLLSNPSPPNQNPGSVPASWQPNIAQRRVFKEIEMLNSDITHTRQKWQQKKVVKWILPLSYKDQKILIQQPCQNYSHPIGLPQQA